MRLSLADCERKDAEVSFKHFSTSLPRFPTNRKLKESRKRTVDVVATNDCEMSRWAKRERRGCHGTPMEVFVDIEGCIEVVATIMHLLYCLNRKERKKALALPLANQSSDVGNGIQVGTTPPQLTPSLPANQGSALSLRDDGCPEIEVRHGTDFHMV